MKDRKGFVSNSSSSSFVIIGKEEDLKPKGIIRTVEELRNRFEYEYGDDFVKYFEDYEKSFNQYKERIENGECIIFLDVEYGSEELIGQLFNNCLVEEE